jgi:hypothetical protein
MRVKPGRAALRDAPGRSTEFEETLKGQTNATMFDRSWAGLLLAMFLVGFAPKPLAHR